MIFIWIHIASPVKPIFDLMEISCFFCCCWVQREVFLVFWYGPRKISFKLQWQILPPCGSEFGDVIEHKFVAANFFILCAFILSQSLIVVCYQFLAIDFACLSMSIDTDRWWWTINVNRWSNRCSTEAFLVFVYYLRRICYHFAVNGINSLDIKSRKISWCCCCCCVYASCTAGYTDL